MRPCGYRKCRPGCLISTLENQPMATKTGPWLYRSASPSSESFNWCISVGAIAVTWPSRLSCSVTRCLSCAVRSPDQAFSRPIERSSAGLSRLLDRQHRGRWFVQPDPCSVGTEI
jgi:hypothetical protein